MNAAIEFIKILSREPVSELTLFQMRKQFKILDEDPVHFADKSLATWLWIDISVRVDLKLLNEYPQVQNIIYPATGETNISTKVLQSKIIKIYNLRPHKKFLLGIPSTAEHAWALLLVANNRIIAAHHHVESGSWDRTVFPRNQLFGKNLGIIGFGRLGNLVSTFATAFGMQVGAFDIDSGRQFSNGIRRYDSLNTLLGVSDYVILTASVNNKNAPILNHDEIQHFKNGSILVNVSRGCLVNQGAVLDSLNKGALSYYASDVRASEDFDSLIKAELSTELELISHSNTLFTPHIGGYSLDARYECELHLLNYVRIGKCQCL
jgi:phosphoglycerate dehydrogenase-like enzyme